MTLFLLVLFAALVFEYINGFHDTANAIATVVSTKVLSPRQAIIWAAVWNLIGALMGTAVASTIGKGLVDTQFVTMATVLRVDQRDHLGPVHLVARVAFELQSCPGRRALRSRTGHGAGRLVGLALVGKECRGRRVRPLAESRDADVLRHFSGSSVERFLMYLLMALLRKATPRLVRLVFGKAQLVSAGFMGYSHGSNDAQKTMGIIALALFTGTQSGAFAGSRLGDISANARIHVPFWVMITCALTMAAGTAAGGWRIIRTWVTRW